MQNYEENVQLPTLIGLGVMLITPENERMNRSLEKLRACGGRVPEKVCYSKTQKRGGGV